MCYVLCASEVSTSAQLCLAACVRAVRHLQFCHSKLVGNCGDAPPGGNEARTTDRTRLSAKRSRPSEVVISLSISWTFYSRDDDVSIQVRAAFAAINVD